MWNLRFVLEIFSVMLQMRKVPSDGGRGREGDREGVREGVREGGREGENKEKIYYTKAHISVGRKMLKCYSFTATGSLQGVDDAR